jgi:hypothetical protein
MSCPACGGTSTFHSHKSKTFLTLLGAVRLRRAYYCCRCGVNTLPFDEANTLTQRRLSLAAEEASSLAGVADDSFGEAAEVLLLKLAGLRLSEATLRRVCEDVGGVLGDELEAGSTYGQDKPFDWHKDNNGQTVAYVSVDATGVPQQGPGAAQAEGRMPYVACVYNPPPRPEERAEAPVRVKRGEGPPPMQARYLAGLYSLPLLGLLLRKQAAQVGMEKAEVWIGMSDGGSGLEDFLQTNFNRADLTIILDFYHPASRLEEVARLWHEGDEKQAQEQAKAWCQKLKHEGGAALLELLRSLPPPSGRALKEKYREMLGYLENHKHKMDYPRYLKRGWQIGSGPIESACKTVVGQRLKLAGMRWKERGTDNICHLRALLRSGKQWHAFWGRRLNKGSICYQPK